MNEQELTLGEKPATTAIIEAVLFAAGYPLEYEKLAEVAEVSVIEVRDCVESLKAQYLNDSHGIQLVTYADSCQFCTREGYEDYIRKALGIKQSGKLSASSMEVLAIIAYNQPVTKAVIEQIRGVDSSYALSILAEKSLIEAVGRLDVPGQPNLYGTTQDFLRVFGLSSLQDLPTMSDTPMQTTFQLEGI